MPAEILSAKQLDHLNLSADVTAFPKFVRCTYKAELQTERLISDYFPDARCDRYTVS